MAQKTRKTREELKRFTPAEKKKYMAELRAERIRAKENNRLNWAQRNHEVAVEVAEKKSAERLGELTALKAELTEQIGEFRKSFDEGARILGENFPLLMQKHVDLALGDSRDAVQARQFLLRHYTTMIPAGESSHSQNDTLMAKGLEAIRQGRAKLVERTIEMIPEDAPETNGIGFDPRYDLDAEYSEA